jgi:hypothetical protein
MTPVILHFMISCIVLIIFLKKQLDDLYQVPNTTLRAMATVGASKVIVLLFCGGGSGSNSSMFGTHMQLQVFVFTLQKSAFLWGCGTSVLS